MVTSKEAPVSEKRYSAPESCVPKGYKQTDVGMIPEEWSTAHLPDVVWYQEGPGVRNYQFTSAGVKLFNGTNIENGKICLDKTSRYISEREANGWYSHFLADAGDIVIACSGITVSRFDEKVGVLSSEHLPLCMNTSTMRFKIASPLLNKDYFKHFLRSQLFKDQISGKATGSAQLNFGPAHVRAALLPLPTKAEQEAIAQALSDADALIESLDQLITKKRQIKQGAMQDLLTGKKRLPQFEIKPGYKQAEVGVIPKDWEVRPLLAAVRIAQGQVDPKMEPYKSMFLVGPVHVESGTGNLVTRQTAGEQGAISGKYLFAEGDIVYGKINPYLRKAFLADFSGLCSADMYPLKPAKDVSSGFMLAVILGHQFTKYAESVSVRSGMPKINRVEMSEFVFPIPSDKAEQSAIATILSDMDDDIAALEKKLAKIRQIKRGMMQELLTGRTRLV